MLRKLCWLKQCVRGPIPSTSGGGCTGGGARIVSTAVHRCQSGGVPHDLVVQPDTKGDQASRVERVPASSANSLRED